ncbi:MAG: hypothetical protein LBG89_00270 [Rickettsiales bacterium]|jgi:hypothetical protein|nr:hypothetical protein [Rickettsiales bacterium]
MIKKSLSFAIIAALAACAQQSHQPETRFGSTYGMPAPQFAGGVGEQRFPRSEAEAGAISRKWNGADVDTKLVEFRGRSVRVQTIKNDSDFKEMRLRMVPAATGGHAAMKNDEVMARVAESSAKRICGAGVEWINVVYDQPSFDSFRPNPFFDYQMDETGQEIREYGFTCEF